MTVPLSKQWIARAFSSYADDVRKIEVLGIELWGEVTAQGKELSSCPSLKTFLKEALDEWDYASRTSGLVLLSGFYLRDPGEQNDYIALLGKYVVLLRSRKKRLREFTTLLQRARTELDGKHV